MTKDDGQPIRRLYQRLRCRIRGHDWDVIASSYRQIILAHVSPIAGCCVECKGCGEARCDIPSNALFMGEAHDCAKEKALR